jgi:PLP dependent protein
VNGHDTPPRVSIAENLRAVRERMERAAVRAGRDPASVRLVAVSKTQPADAVRAAYHAGCRDFGENYAQELVDKAAALADLAPRWHHIGHLQSNKVRALAGKVALYHAVDRASLAAEIARRSERAAVLLQVNVAGEVQKSGCRPDDLPALVSAVRALGNIELRGLMTMPPAAEPEAVRPWFRALRELRDHLAPELPELSMGMSHDFDVAIEEGATLVRVGTAIFGAR